MNSRLAFTTIFSLPALPLACFAQEEGKATPVDPGYTTVLNSGMLVQECLTGIAMRKTGVTETGYHRPLTVDDDEE